MEEQRDHRAPSTDDVTIEHTTHSKNKCYLTPNNKSQNKQQKKIDNEKWKILCENKQNENENEEIKVTDTLSE